MVKPTRILLGVAILWLLSSAISDPGGLLLNVLYAISDFSGVNIDPLINVIEAINWSPLETAVDEVYQLGKDLLEILENHTKAPDTS